MVTEGSAGLEASARKLCKKLFRSEIKRHKNMSSENVQPIIRSYALASRFANGRVIADRLKPPAYRRIATLHQKTWREEPLSTGCDWGVTNFSFLIPESVTVLSSLFLASSFPIWPPARCAQTPQQGRGFAEVSNKNNAAPLQRVATNSHPCC